MLVLHVVLASLTLLTSLGTIVHVLSSRLHKYIHAHLVLLSLGFITTFASGLLVVLLSGQSMVAACVRLGAYIILMSSLLLLVDYKFIQKYSRPLIGKLH